MSILFATPMYGGMCHEKYFYSCSLLADALNKAGIRHDWISGRNESLIHRARMELLRSFLEQDYSHLCWIDADMDFTPEDFAKLWNLEVDIAVGIYSMKLPDKPLSAWRDGKLVKLEECPSEPFEVDYAGTGFMLIKRSAIEAIHVHREKQYQRCKEFAERMRGDLYTDGGASGDEEEKFLKGMLDYFAPSYEGNHGMVPALFQSQIYDGCLESEDYNFCRLAREAGLKIIADPSIRLGHWGGYRYGA